MDHPGQLLAITNPATGQCLAQLVQTDTDSLPEKLQRAQRAAGSWAQQPVAARQAVLQRFGENLSAQRDVLAQRLTAEMGKPLSQARREIEVTVQRLAYFIAEAPEVMAAQPGAAPVGGVQEHVTQEPLGVITQISAWNYPYFLGTNVFVPALLCGNAVLYKPSEHACLSGLAMAELLWAAGVPRDVFTPCIGAAQLGQALLQLPTAAVCFTGSYATGVQVAQAAAGRLCRVQLELGGKDAAYVMADADVLASAKSLAQGAFYNSGQSCCSVERLYVHRSKYSALVAALVAEVQQFCVGDPLRPETFVGPLTRAAQVQVLEAQVADATARGGVVRCGGRPLQGQVFMPTVVSEAHNAMLLMREETFGPLLGVACVDSDAEALQQMQDSPYGLTCAVYGRNSQRAAALLEQVQVGTAYINCSDRVSVALPWSGRRHSGLGSTLSHTGIAAMLQPKAWHVAAAP
jgi:acyl-CoA reductase-like NAD-dependent aldehyde dehydrogenase